MPRQAHSMHEQDRLTDDVVRLRDYAGAIRRAIRSGHRLSFTAEQVLAAVQQTARLCSGSAKRIRAQSKEGRLYLDEIAAAQDQIDDTIMALRERVMFERL